MMKRKLFFWLEQLKISRGERQAVTILIIVLLGLMLINMWLKPKPAFKRSSYAKIEKVFSRRTALLNAKHRKTMAAYRGIPVSSVQLDTLPVIRKQIEPININQASKKALITLPGIGSVYAQHIIRYRNENGPFTSKRELLKVTGIGDARLAKIESYIILGAIKQTNKTEHVVDKISQEPNGSKALPVNRALINVNTANLQALITLPGIGDAYAQNIINFRKEHGVFTTFKELLKIDGIGKKRLENLIPYIKLKGESE